jgi:RimJ/RimL family protein N-acetyltransferase
VLEGKLVRLRATEPEDVQAVHYWMNDPEVTEYLTARYPRATSDDFWLAGASSSGGPNSFAVVRLAIETKGGEHIGAINLHQIVPEDRRAGLGIIIGAKAYWGRGYGADAIETLLRFAFEEMNLHRVWLTVLDAHERGIACYRRCGFREETRMRKHIFRHGRYHDFIQMGILREEFQALHDGGKEGGRDA